ncbi:MAG: amidohydrolase family protein, partial [Planctomycetota bacterium]
EDESIDLAVRVMDETGVAASVDLSGGTGEKLRRKVELAARHPGRFLFFCAFPFEEEDRDNPDVGKKLADSLEQSVAAGAVGCGEMGFSVIHGYHEWDDPRLAPFWEKAVELVAQPSRYWRPESPHNRMEEESLHGKAPKCQHEMLRDRDRVLERYPDLVVIAAHCGYAADQVPYLVYLMEKFPNFYVDISAVLEEWGKRPYEFRDFCMDYQGRILYGTDWGVHKKAIEVAGSVDKMIADWKAFATAHYVFLGSDQRWIPCPFGGNQGRYVGYRVDGFPRYYHDGADLPDGVLEKVYFRNAERLFGINVSDNP